MSTQNIVTEDDLGPEFDIGNIQAGNIRLKLGSGLAIQLDGTIIATNTLPPMAFADVTGNANAVNTLLTLTNARNDTGWTFSSNVATYNGTPDRVRVEASTWFQVPLSNAFARIAPHLELLRNGTLVAKSDTGYQRHTAGHRGSSNVIVFTDPNPGTNPQYSLRSQQGGTQNDIMNINLGHMSLEAIV